MRATESKLGPVDVLVNNAVTRNFSHIDAMSKADWDRALAVNLSAPFHLIKLTLPGMKARKWGRIINLASNWGLTGTVGRGDYVASKHGLVGLTKAVALEALPYNITCNALAPGSILTPHAERQVRERMARDKLDWEVAAQEFLKTRQPSGPLRDRREGRPADRLPVQRRGERDDRQSDRHGWWLAVDLSVGEQRGQQHEPWSGRQGCDR